MRYGHIDIEPGFGFITQVEGVPGPAKEIAYISTFVMPDGVYPGIEHQIPHAARWPDPLVVTPHEVNTPFPAFRVNRQFQPFMIPELPQFTPCPSNGLMQNVGGLLGAVAAMDPTQRAALRRLIMEGA